MSDWVEKAIFAARSEWLRLSEEKNGFVLAERMEKCVFKALSIVKAEVERLKKENEEEKALVQQLRKNYLKLLAEKNKIIKAINDRSLNKIANWEFMDIIQGAEQ